jgi:hypothetical protein
MKPPVNSIRSRQGACRFGDETGNDRHCRLCGSLLYSVIRGNTLIHEATETLVDDPTIRPTEHTFVGSKARWYTITDDLPNTQGLSR